MTKTLNNIHENFLIYNNLENSLPNWYLNPGRPAFRAFKCMKNFLVLKNAHMKCFFYLYNPMTEIYDGFLWKH